MHAHSCIADVPTSGHQYFTAEENQLIGQALHILEQRLFQRGPRLANPRDVEEFLRLKLAGEDREVFAVLFLDNRHRVIAFEPLFWGTIDGAQVSPRIILQRAFEHRCAALVIVHNHPSGCVEASRADRILTDRLKHLLADVDIRMLDHFIVGQGEPFSFAKAGLL